MRHAAGLLLAMLAVGAAHGADVTSAYTSLDLRRCKLVKEESEGGYARHICPGLGGVAVRAEEFDDRSAVAFPLTPCPDVPATFSGFNSFGTMVEWRLARGRPFAAIVRYTVQDPQTMADRTWLVVSWLEKGRSCPAAIVSGATLDANTVARVRADALLAHPFRCGSDVPALVATGEAPQGSITSAAVCP